MNKEDAFQWYFRGAQDAAGPVEISPKRIRVWFENLWTSLPETEHGDLAMGLDGH